MTRPWYGHAVLRLALLVAALPLGAAADDDRVLGAREGGGAWVAGQVNVILQAHPAFDARSSGPNSLRAAAEGRTSLVATLYAGVALARWTEALADLELAAGRGLSDALGLAGFTNADVVRNPSLGATPYLARAMLRQIVPLSSELERAEPGPLGVAPQLPRRRLELRAGKLSTVDFFDTNAVGSDSHLQLMNWALVNDAAYDYAADTRGYTWGLYAEYADAPVTVRAAALLMPKVANGIDLEWDVSRALAENVEVDVRYSLGGRAGALRLYGFANRARMGLYRAAIDAAPAGEPPEVARTREGRVKLGAGVNVEQALTAWLSAFARAGASDGAIESFAYTEADDALSGGVRADGAAWRRDGDRAGVAVATSGLAAPHREYLARGGRGFLLGDGALRYGREQIVEAYYTARVWRGTYVAADVQGIRNPGYDRDRGPVLVGALRLHVDL